MNEEQLKEFSQLHDEFKNHKHIGTDNKKISYNDLDDQPTISLDSISDVVITTPTTGDYLYYNGTNWVNTPFPTDETFTYTFGETVTANTPMRQGYDTSILYLNKSDATETTSFNLVRYDPAATNWQNRVMYTKYMAQSFSYTYATTLSRVILRYIAATGSDARIPAVKVGIQADSSGSPSGTYLGSSGFVTLPTRNSVDDATFDLSSPLNISANTTYWIVLSVEEDPSSPFNVGGDLYYAYKDNGGTTGAATCDWLIRYNTSGTAGSWKSKNNDDSAWTSRSGNLSFKLYESEVTTRVYKASSDSQDKVDHYLGVATSAVNAGATSTAIARPTNFVTTTGLTAGSLYYLTDTAGTLGTSQGTVKKIVGTALSTTKLLLQ